MEKMPDSSKPWVVIRLGNALFGVSSSQVQQMISMPDVNSVPYAPDHIRGVINLRGKVMPLIDLRVRLGMVSAKTETDNLVDMLCQRKEDHRNWIRELILCLDEKRPFLLATDPHKCAFGKWYDTYRSDNLLVSSILPKFDEPHKRIHALADDAFGLQKQGNDPGAKELVHVAEKTDLAIVMELFDNLCKTIRESCREIALILMLDQQYFAAAVDGVESVEAFSSQFEPLPDLTSNNLCGFVGTRLKDKSHILILEPSTLLAGFSS